MHIITWYKGQFIMGLSQPIPGHWFENYTPTLLYADSGLKSSKHIGQFVHIL